MTRSRPRTTLETQAYPDARVRRSLLRLLDDSPLCALATIGPRRRAHINTAYFAYSPDFEFFFLSDPGSVHAQNLRRERTAALAVFRSPQTWGGDDRGVQLFGTCTEARGRTLAAAERAYAHRFPPYRRWAAGIGITPAQAAQFRTYRFFRFLPRRFKILDEAELRGTPFVEGAFRRRP